MLESGVGRAHNVALSSLENFSLPGDVAASSRYWTRDVVLPAIEVSPSGQIRQSHEPGIGYEIDQEWLERVTANVQIFAE
jgi:O-succinylbenzoate synthase